MSWRKAVLITLATLAVLLAGAALAVRALVDPEKLRRTAEDHVRAAWGRDVRVGGVSLDLLPWPSVHATGVALSAPPWARSKNVLEVDQVDASLELVPLFVGRVRVKALDLQGVKAALEEADDGAESWQPGGTEASEGRKAPVAGASMPVGEIHLRNVVIHRRVKKLDSEPWLVEDALVTMAPGMRDVQAEIRVKRHDIPLDVKARFDDLSHLGTPGAVTGGRVDLALRETQATLEGRLPLERSLQGHEAKLTASSKSLADVFAFFGVERGATQPFSLALSSQASKQGAELRGVALTLGDLRVTGDLQLAFANGARHVTGHLASTRIDWLKVLAQSGGTVKPPRHDDQIFHPDPVAWRAVAFLGALDADLDLAIDALRLGNGLQLEAVRTHAVLGSGVASFDPFAAKMLGGSGGGSLRLDAARQDIRARFEGEGLLLEQWFHERGSKIPFRGGPMAIKAQLALHGATFRELAASIAGPVTLRMGRGTWASPKAGEVEEMMVSALAPKGSTDLNFDCVVAKLDFRRGRAQGRNLLGARSEVSQLLTSGSVDFNAERVDLRGRVQARRGITVGLATVAGGVRISGSLAHPHIGMDPDEKPALLARAAAAVATAGASIVGEALINAAAKDDPCEAVVK